MAESDPTLEKAQEGLRAGQHAESSVADAPTLVSLMPRRPASSSNATPAPAESAELPIRSELPRGGESAEYPTTSLRISRGDRVGEKGRFQIIERVGRGGMGHVFRAADLQLDRFVAIKFIFGDNVLAVDELVALLKKEARVTAKLNHENIVAVFDIDAHDGVPFLVMELLDGQSLDVMTERSRLPALRATRIMTHIARGLAHAHANGVVHRDLKPSNVFVLRDGRAKILDFGIARSAPSAAASVAPDAASALAVGTAPTMGGIGTPGFMAPEQWRGAHQDARTDIWAAGVIFYQMLTGRLPYSASELVKFRWQTRVRAIAPSVRMIVPTLPVEADRLVATALNEDPEGRFPGGSELLEELVELERVLTDAAESSEEVRGSSTVERRTLTILSCVLHGLASMNLDEIAQIDRFFYEACFEAVRRWDGSIGTPVGGRVLCCFGYPIAREADAQHAVQAALEIAETMREQIPAGCRTPSFTIGIHSGTVGLPSFSPVGYGIPAIQGDAPNVAVRLAERASPDTVTLSRATLELVGGAFAVEPSPSSADANEPEGPPADAFVVTAEIDSVNRFGQTSSGQMTPFVGREPEVHLLFRLWNDAGSGRGQMLVIRGEPGIGKSRLVQVLRDHIREERRPGFTCQCRPHFKNSALNPIIELVRVSMRIRRDDRPETKLEKLEANLAELGFGLPEYVPLFCALLSIPLESRYAALGLSPEQQKVKTLEALVSMLRRATREGPALLIIEDMQWADYSTIEFLNTLIEAVPASRLLVVLTARPEFRPPWSVRGHLHQLTLDRLSPASTAAMIDRASRRRRLPPDIVRRLVATADGIPLFVEELTRMVVDSIAAKEDDWKSDRIAIPNTLHELLIANLERLRGVGKEVAQFAAVLGRDFHYGLIRHVSPHDELSLQEGLEILARAGILHRRGEPPNSKYVFKHALIQQTAYQSIVPAELRLHHRRAAQVLTEVFPETADVEPELLAYHHAEAGNVEQAISFWEKAAVRATQRSALVEAIDHYTKALDTLRSLPEGSGRDKRELALLLGLGSPLMSVHGYANAEVQKTYARARELAHAAGVEADVFPAMQGLWQYYYVRGLLPTARALGEQLLDIAHRSGSSTFLLLAHRSVASTAFLQGDFETCRAHTHSGLAIYDVREHGSLSLVTAQDPGVAHGVYQAWALWMLGFPDQALDCVTRTVDLARRLSHPMSIAYALCFAALIRNHRGDHVEAAAFSDEALAITTENRFALWTAWSKMQRGWALSSRQEYEQGIPQMTEGLAGWKNTGARVGFTFFPVTLSEICLRAGHLADATLLLEDAAPMIARNDEHFYEPELLRVQGELALRKSGDEAAAEADTFFRKGIELARALAAKSWELRLLTSRARLFESRAASPAALEELQQAYAWFREGHATADLCAARLQLEMSESRRGPRRPDRDAFAREAPERGGSTR